jgi:hypothetical protein
VSSLRRGHAKVRLPVLATTTTEATTTTTEATTTEATTPTTTAAEVASAVWLWLPP